MKRGIPAPPPSPPAPASAPEPSQPAQPSPARAPAPQSVTHAPLEGDLAVLAEWSGSMLLGLPRAWTLRCCHDESGREFYVTTSRRAFELLLRRGDSVAHGDDWRDLCIAAGQGRMVLAIEQWLLPAYPPPPPADPPNLAPQPLRAMLGPHWPETEAPIANLSVRAVLEHFRCSLRTLDPDLSLPSVREGLL